MRFSIVVPVHNEGDNIRFLLSEFNAVLGSKKDFEVIYVNDASTDTTAAELKSALCEYSWLRVIEHRGRSGQSAALCSGINAAHAPVIVTLDGDGQNDPADIPDLQGRYDTEPGDSMLAGHRVNRCDNFSKRLSSRVANAFRSSFLKDGVPDTGCGLKVFSRKLFMQFERFDHMHRFLPALAKSQGAQVKSIAVNHRERARGKTKYGLNNRLWVGIEDMLGVRWLQSKSTENKVHNTRLQNFKNQQGQAWLRRRQCDVLSQEIFK